MRAVHFSVASQIASNKQDFFWALFHLLLPFFYVPLAVKLISLWGRFEIHFFSVENLKPTHTSGVSSLHALQAKAKKKVGGKTDRAVELILFAGGKDHCPFPLSTDYCPT